MARGRLPASFPGWLGGAALVASLLASPPVAARTGEAQVQEDEVKAAFIYNFVKFVEWPCESVSGGCGELRIGLLGRGPLGSSLEETVHGKQVRGHRIRVLRFSSVREVGDVHILFVVSREVDLDELLERLGDRPVLTVGEAGDFAERGGVIRLFLEGRRMRFEINPDAAKRHGIRVSSELLALARIVGAER